MFSRGSRGRGTGRHARGSRDGAASPPPTETAVPSADDGATAEVTGDATASGPYDIADAPEAKRLDLGALKLPSVPGVEVRVQANQQGTVQQIYLVRGESALQLGAFAAPRTEDIWDEVRAEIKQSLIADGGTATERPGEYGTELHARVRTQQGQRDLRFVGVSGPRWLVRAVFQGPAATDSEQAAPLLQCLRGLVVERGDEPRPVREPLPLRLSPEMAAQAQRRAAAQAAGGPAGGAPAPPPGQASAGPQRPPASGNGG